MRTLKVYMALLLVAAAPALYAQDCKVLLAPINQSYEGECKRGKADGEGAAVGLDRYTGHFKKGYPHGEGVYTYNNGDVYKGTFVKGLKNGKGTLTKADGSVKEGFWKEGDYTGLYKTPYKKLDKSQNISSYTIATAKFNTNTIRFYVKEDQNNVRNPGANIVLHNGNYTNEVKTRDYLELLGVTFPFKAKIYFNQDYIEFEIFNSGSWNITTSITNINGLNNN